jgi:hypothetical protein
VFALVASCDAAPAVFVSENEAEGVTPDTEAVTANEPAVLFAVKVGAVPRPLVLVITVVVPEGVAPANVPEAPEAGAVKVTVTPESPFPAASVTLAASAVENAVDTVAVWPEPAEEFTALGGADTVTWLLTVLAAVHDW